MSFILGVFAWLAICAIALAIDEWQACKTHTKFNGLFFRK